MIKLVIFDFDGTLVDSQDVGIALYNRLAPKYKTRKIEDLESLWKLALLERLKALNISLIKLPGLIADMKKEYEHSLPCIEMFPGMRELLLDLKGKSHSVAIISSNAESNIRDYFRSNRLDVLGTVLSPAHLWGKDKAIKKLLRDYHLRRDEAVYVGDEVRDIEACQKVGVKIICVDWGHDPLELLQGAHPDYMASSAEDIRSILARYPD